MMSVYGAAILVIPLLLNSVFEVSTTYLGFQNISQQDLMLSIYSELNLTYFFVEGLLFVGLVITSILSGISLGRKFRSTETMLNHLGVARKRIRGLMATVLLSLSTFSTLLGFCLAIVLSSGSLYAISTAFGIPATSIAVGPSSLVYLLFVFLASFLFLLLGWSSTLRKRS